MSSRGVRICAKTAAANMANEAAASWRRFRRITCIPHIQQINIALNDANSRYVVLEAAFELKLT
jgi:hypothetical protein